MTIVEISINLFWVSIIWAAFLFNSYSQEYEGIIDSPPAFLGDKVYEYWKDKKKYYLIISADESLDPQNNLEYVEVNAKELAEALKKFGYKELDILSGKRATEDNIKRILTDALEEGYLNDNSVLLIFYAGHGAFNSKDSLNPELWLQLYGTSKTGPFWGLNSEFITNLIRNDDNFQGTLTYFIDACFSGAAINKNNLTIGLGGKYNVNFITSSQHDLESGKVELPNGERRSVFTYLLLKALNEEWGVADSSRDGILTHIELLTFIKNRMLDMKNKGQIFGDVKPIGGLAGADNVWVAYNQELAFQDSPDRESIYLMSFNVRESEEIEYVDILNADGVVLNSKRLREGNNYIAYKPPKTGQVKFIYRVGEEEIINTLETNVFVHAEELSLKPGVEVVMNSEAISYPVFFMPNVNLKNDEHLWYAPKNSKIVWGEPVGNVGWVKFPLKDFDAGKSAWFSPDQQPVDLR